VLVSDTHGTDGHRLRDRTLDAVREADLVAHAGDVTTAAALDALRREADRLLAVHGNADDPDVTDRLPGARTFVHGGVRFALTHTRRGGATGLSLFGRERGADAVVYGHSHRPSVAAGDGDGPVLLNPGSHAEPRGARPGHAELVAADGGLCGRLRGPDGTVFETFALAAGD